MPFASAQDRVQTLAPGLQHSLAMLFQPSRLGEAQQDSLRQLIGMQIAPQLGFGKACNQRARADDPAHSQPGESEFRKTAQQHCIAACVELLDGRDRLAFIGQRTVDIVFHYDYSGCLRDTEKCLPRCYWKCCAGWVLKIGSDG